MCPIRVSSSLLLLPLFLLLVSTALTDSPSSGKLDLYVDYHLTTSAVSTLMSSFQSLPVLPLRAVRVLRSNYTQSCPSSSALLVNYQDAECGVCSNTRRSTALDPFNYLHISKSLSLVHVARIGHVYLSTCSRQPSNRQCHRDCCTYSGYNCNRI